MYRLSGRTGVARVRVRGHNSYNAARRRFLYLGATI